MNGLTNIESFWEVLIYVFLLLFAIPLLGLVIAVLIGLFNFLIEELMKKGEEYIMNNNGGVPRQFTKATLEFWVGYVICFIVGAVAIGMVLIFSPF